MSRLERILIRDTTALCRAFGGAGRSTSSPSMRYLRREVFSIASKWMSDAFVFRASIMIVLTMRMTGASPAASSVASRASALLSSPADISMSLSSPFMMFSIARAGLEASAWLFRRRSASFSSGAGATSVHILPCVHRDTSSWVGRSNGSENAIAKRPFTFMRGRAFARFQASISIPQRSSCAGVNPCGMEMGCTPR